MGYCLGTFVLQGINWDDVYNRKMEPPYKPQLSSDSDVSMFDPSFTGMKPIVSPGNSDEHVPPDLFQVSLAVLSARRFWIM